MTGAASGIGLALARLLSARDYRLQLCDIDGGRLGRAASELEPERVLHADVADPAAMQSVADEVGAVEFLCLNAGVISSSPGAPWEAPPAEWNRVLGVNLLGVVNGLRSFVPLMLEQPDPCHILITASLAGAATWPGGGPYAASKHAVLAVAEQAALGLADTNVSVTVLCPALVRTGMSSEGVEPAVVAAQALEAVDDRRFAVLPDEWATAVAERAATLIDGTQPSVPQPNTQPALRSRSAAWPDRVQ